MFNGIKFSRHIIYLILYSTLYATQILAFRISTNSHGSHSNTMSMKLATLDESTLWKLKIMLQKDGFPNVNILASIRFVERKGYEPPQGSVFIEDDYNGFFKVNDKGGYAKSWTLSEDKDDRKDGLWIWGLFKEPKYPYLYFSLDVYNTTISSTGEELPLYNGEGIPNNRLNFRFDHRREQMNGVRLSQGLVTYQVTELVKADVLGLGGDVNVGDMIEAGYVEITPV